MGEMNILNEAGYVSTQNHTKEFNSKSVTPEK